MCKFRGISSKALLFALVALMGISAAYTQSFTGSTSFRYDSGYASSPSGCRIDVYADITHSPTFNVVASQGGASPATFCPGNVNIVVSQTGYADAGTIRQSTTTGSYDGGGASGGHIPYNFDTNTYNTLTGRLGTCIGTWKDFYTDDPSDPCYFVPSNGANVGVLYYNGLFPDCGPHSGNGNVYLYCSETISVNGGDYKLGQTINVPITATTTIPVSMKYSCITLHVGKGAYGNYYQGTVYSNPSQITVAGNLQITVGSCGCAITSGILAVGVAPSPVLFTANTAPGTITVQNTGTGTLNVTSITPQAGFTFTPSGALPLNMAAGTSASIPGTFTYTGGGAMPATMSITASGTSTCCTGLCGVSSTITVSITTVVTGGADLVPAINVLESISSADIAITNWGLLSTVNASTLKVEILHCTAAADSACTISDSYYPTPVIGAGGSNTVRVVYACSGSAYVKIRATADSSSTVSETNEGNNIVGSYFIPCDTQTCSISGSNSFAAPGAYLYTAVCRDFDGTPADCGYMLNDDFSWSISPVSGTFATYTLDEDTTADRRVNATLNVLGISTNGTITISASSHSTLDNSPIDCDINVDALEDTCAKQI